ncbi:hypothetical protein Tco_1220685 [Tanacetum coccineum]
MLDADAVRLCLLIVGELVFMGKEKRNTLNKHIMWLVDDLDAWNSYPWGEYMWVKFYKRTVNVVAIHTAHHLAEMKKTQNSMQHTIYTGLLGHSRSLEENLAKDNLENDIRKNYLDYLGGKEIDYGGGWMDEVVCIREKIFYEVNEGKGGRILCGREKLGAFREKIWCGELAFGKDGGKIDWKERKRRTKKIRESRKFENNWRKKGVNNLEIDWVMEKGLFCWVEMEDEDGKKGNVGCGKWNDLRTCLGGEGRNEFLICPLCMTVHIWILEIYPSSEIWWSKKANVIPRGLAWSKVMKFEKSDYTRLFGPLSKPSVALISTPGEMTQAWFRASVEFIKDLADHDGNFLQDDVQGMNVFQCDEARDNEGDGVLADHNGQGGHLKDGNFVEGLDETVGPNSNPVSVEEGDGVLDSDVDAFHLSQIKAHIQQPGNVSTMLSTSPQLTNASVAEFFVEFDAIKNQVSLIKKCKADELDKLTERISKFESSQTFVMFKRLLKSGVCTEKEATEEIPNICSDHNVTSNHTACMSTEAMPSSSCSHPANEDIASHCDDHMENDAENEAENEAEKSKDDYNNS